MYWQICNRDHSNNGNLYHPLELYNLQYYICDNSCNTGISNCIVHFKRLNSHIWSLLHFKNSIKLIKTNRKYMCLIENSVQYSRKEKVWRIYSFQAIGERKFSKRIDHPKHY